MGTRDRSQASTVRKACRGCLRMSFLVRSVRLQFECVDNSWVRRDRQLRAALNVLRPLTTTRYGIEPSAPLKPEIRASERERARERRRERESVRLPITPTNDGTHNRSKSCRILSIYAIVSHHAAFYANTCIEAMRQALVRRCGRVQENACCFSRYLFSKKTLLPLISSTNTTMYLIWLIWI
jgi:hypothetical protein